MAYAFLMSLNRLGAGNPKGVALARWDWGGEPSPLLVVDEYRVPRGERPIISPAITDNQMAVETFIKLADTIDGSNGSDFKRTCSGAALKRLQDASAAFVQTHLNGK